MRVNRQGITRIVLILNNKVIKIPNFISGWKYFLQGILANINESTTWKNHTRKDLLCPVLWSSWGGWILIMSKALPCTFYNEQGIEIDYSKWITEGLGGDDKPDNYGIFKGDIVKIDYAD